MAEKIISDAALTEKLQDVFGIGNIVSADRSLGYHQVFFSDKKYATEVLNMLDQKGFGDHLMQSLGGFGDIFRPNIWIALGNESQRSNDAELNQAALKLLDTLSADKDALQSAAGIGISNHRA